MNSRRLNRHLPRKRTCSESSTLGGRALDDAFASPHRRPVAGDVGRLSVDGGLEVDDCTPRFSRRSVSVEPGARGRREVEDEARVTGEPGQHLRLICGRRRGK